MKRALSTEELLRGLSPEARDEAIRLAARLQVESDQSRSLLAAAREAGIEECHLREAAHRLRGAPVEMPPASRLAWSFEHPLAASLAFVFAFLQLLGIAAFFAGAAPETLWLLLGVSAALGVTLPRARARYSAPGFVALTGAVIIGLHLLHIHWGNGLSLAGAAESAWRLVAAEVLVAWLGAALAGLRNRRGRLVPLGKPSLIR